MADSLSSATNEAIRQFTDSACLGYDQFGSMLGEVFVTASGSDCLEPIQTFELNLPGLRKRQWRANGPGRSLGRSATIFGVCVDGLVFQVGAFSDDNVKR